MIDRGYFGRALHVVGGDPVTYVAGGLVLHILSLVAFGLLIGPAIAGLVWITLKHLRAEEVSFGDVFRGFDNFGSTFLAGLVFSLMVSAGLALCVVPGVILGGLFCFTFPFIVDRRMLLPEAMVASRTLAEGRADLLDKSLFFLLALLVGASGVVLCVVGLLFTWPLMWAVVAVAYEDLAGPAPPVAED